MTPNDPSRLLDSIARQEIPDTLDLWPQITSRVKKKTFLQTLRTRPALLLLLILLALSLLFGVAYAVDHLLGYIPGVGIVDQSLGIRVLAEPVWVKQDGITVTVSQVVADSLRTFVRYGVGGIFEIRSGWPICTEWPLLRLQDGSELSPLGGGGISMETNHIEPMSFETYITFPPIPAQAKSVIFISPCQMPAIELVLVPAPASLVTPAEGLEVTFESSGPQFAFATTPQVPEETNIPETYDTSFPSTPTPVPHGSGLYLDQIVETDNAYILIGNFTDAGDLPGAVGNIDENSIQITGGDGQRVYRKIRYDIRPIEVWENASYWAYEIPKPVYGPLTLTLAEIPIWQSSIIRLPLNVGEDPQPGQKWELNTTVNLGGYDFVIEDITASEKGYTIHFHSDASVPDGLGLGFLVAGADPTDTTGFVQRLDQKVVYRLTMIYDEVPPRGSLTFLLMLNQIVLLPGPWTLTWSPPSP